MRNQMIKKTQPTFQIINSKKKAVSLDNDNTLITDYFNFKTHIDSLFVILLILV